MKRLFAFFLALTVLPGFGCSHQADSGRWIRMAREANRQADRALQENDRRSAIASLKNILEARVPENLNESDARVVRQDACFRLASLELVANHPEEALRWSEHGLNLGRSQDLFTANLLVVRGRALQQQGQPVQAARDYHQALIINEGLLDKALNTGQGRKQP